MMRRSLRSKIVIKRRFVLRAPLRSVESNTPVNERCNYSIIMKYLNCPNTCRTNIRELSLTSGCAIFVLTIPTSPRSGLPGGIKCQLHRVSVPCHSTTVARNTISPAVINNFTQYNFIQTLYAYNYRTYSWISVFWFCFEHESYYQYYRLLYPEPPLDELCSNMLESVTQ